MPLFNKKQAKPAAGPRPAMAEVLMQRQQNDLKTSDPKQSTSLTNSVESAGSPPVSPSVDRNTPASPFAQQRKNKAPGGVNMSVAAKPRKDIFTSDATTKPPPSTTKATPPVRRNLLASIISFKKTGLNHVEEKEKKEKKKEEKRLKAEEKRQLKEEKKRRNTLTKERKGTISKESKETKTPDAKTNTPDAKTNTPDPNIEKPKIKKRTSGVQFAEEPEKAPKEPEEEPEPAPRKTTAAREADAQAFLKRYSSVIEDDSIVKSLLEAEVDIPDEITSNYKFIKRLGRGAFAIVYLLQHRKNADEQYALKVIDKRKVIKKQRMRDEIEAMKKSNHKYIIMLKNSWETEDHAFLLVENADGGELFDRLVEKGVLSELEAAVMMKKLLEAVQHMHLDMNVIHRDLKTENIMLRRTDDGKGWDPKIIDFGIAKLFDDKEDVGHGTMMKKKKKPEPKGRPKKTQRAHSQVGSEGYTAPEILSGHPYDHSVDIWSLGVILYIIISGAHPFTQDFSLMEQVERIMSGRVDFPGPWCTISDACKDMIQKMLLPDPLDRPSASEALFDPWIRNPAKFVEAHQKKMQEEEEAEAKARAEAKAKKEAEKEKGEEKPQEEKKEPEAEQKEDEKEEKQEEKQDA